MPFVSKHTTSDEWQREAIRLADIIRKGPGSPHARVETLKQTLLATAAENFAAGKAEGQSAATPVSMMGELEHLRVENVALKGKLDAKPVAQLPVSDTDLMEAMRMADAAAQNDDEGQPAGISEALRKLAMEVAKLRYQAKAAAK